MSELIHALPYEMPTSEREAALKLAGIVGVPEGLVPVGADYNDVAAALAGLVLFRHLDRLKRNEVMRTIGKFEHSHRPFYGQLQGKIANVIANPRWQNWSLTTEELEKIAAFHGRLGRTSDVIGANPGVIGIAGSVWSMIKDGFGRWNIVGFCLSVVLVGVNEASYQTGRNATLELNRRTRAANPTSIAN